jgi:hypothetical protein
MSRGKDWNMQACDEQLFAQGEVESNNHSVEH